MRLSTEFWVSAYLRQCAIAGDFAALTRKGASHGGAVFVVVNRLDGTFDLYAPAPQSLIGGDEDDAGGRIFLPVLSCVAEDEIARRLEKETRFDGDLWVVERENRAGRHDLDVAQI